MSAAKKITLNLDDYKIVDVNYKLDDEKAERLEKNIEKILQAEYEKQKKEFEEAFNEEFKATNAELMLSYLMQKAAKNYDKNKDFFEALRKIERKESEKVIVELVKNNKEMSAATDNLSKEIITKNKIDIDKELEKYKSFLIYEDKILTSLQKKEKALQLIKFLLNSFFYVNDKILFLNKKECIYSKFNDKDVKNLIEKACIDKDLFFYDKNERMRVLIDSNNFLTYIKIYNVYSSISFVNDVFAKNSNVILDKDRKEIIFVRNKILIRAPKKLNVDEKIKREIIEDYREHWGNDKLQDFIDYIVAIRFANDRKLSYLNLNAPSNWGKSFLMSIFEELGISAEVRMSDLREDKASGLSVNSVLNSFVLFIDEFKKFSNVLFKYTHNVIIEEKFKQAVKVPVYSKILLNADESESFSYAVDEQIKNRVLVMKIKNSTKLDERELFLKNSYLYKEVVKQYFYDEITKRINYYKMLGEIESVAEAERKIRELAKKYRIESDFNVDDLIKQTVAEYLLNLKDKKEDELTNFDKKILDKIIFDNNFVYIKSAVKTILSILKEELDEAEYKKVEYKKAQLQNILNAENKVYKINKKTIRAFRIELNTLEFFLLNKEEQKELIKEAEEIESEFPW